MRNYKQTILEAPRGNCFSTCLACILELDPSIVPNFIGDFPDDWLQRLQAWLEPMNIGVVVVVDTGRSSFYPSGYSIMSCLMVGGSNRHCVVAKDGEVVWDPSPKDRQIYISGLAWTVLSILDPAKPINKEVYSR